MNSFGRVVRLALAHRITFALSVVCALGVAVLWGGNITAVYPLVEIVLDNKDGSEWVADEIAITERSIMELTAEAATIQESLSRPSSSTGRFG